MFIVFNKVHILFYVCYIVYGVGKKLKLRMIYIFILN